VNQIIVGESLMAHKGNVSFCMEIMVFCTFHVKCGIGLKRKPTWIFILRWLLKKVNILVWLGSLQNTTY